jgi:hypothetical protein
MLLYIDAAEFIFETFTVSYGMASWLRNSMKHELHDRIPVIDLFAGPGGLAEGFSAFDDEGGKVFRVGLSMEKDPYAHSTLELRSFFRQFPLEQVPEEYYSYLRKEISREELFSAWPEEAGRAKQEAWRAELGSEKLSDDEVSGLSCEEDTFERWEERIWEIMDDSILYDAICHGHGKKMQAHIEMALSGLCETSNHNRGKEFLPFDGINRDDWYDDPRLKGVCNHTTKAHMPSDLHRYLFAACFSEIHERSLTLPEFPKKLWPEHKNAHKAKRSGNFSDRFRVQLASKPATTVMSHISKDGHYYIQYDVSQCGSRAGAEIL